MRAKRSSSNATRVSRKAGSVRVSTDTACEPPSSNNIPSVNDLFASVLDSDGEQTDESSSESEDADAMGDHVTSAVSEEVSGASRDVDGGAQNSEDSDVDDDGSEDEEDLQHFGQSLEKLKESDPDFYKFLQENDQDLLDTNVEQVEDDQSSDNEPEQDNSLSGAPGLSSVQQINNFARQLSQGCVRSSFRHLSQLVHEQVEAAVQSARSASAVSQPEVFNALLALCMQHVPAALARFVPADDSRRPLAGENKKWVQVRAAVKSYLGSMCQLLCCCNSASLQRILLRHLLALSGYLVAVSTTSSTSSSASAAAAGSSAVITPFCRHLVTRLLRLWSSDGEQQVRVLCFMLIYRLAQRQPALCDTLLKKCYMSYVRCCVFTSAVTWPDIHLMRRCLVELYQVSPAASYQPAFLFIRQLAIHLRNAKLDKSRFQVVYNWQYVHCLLFWSDLLADTGCDELRLLVYPLVQIMLGTVTLVPTRRHYPLRLHVLASLTRLSAATRQFIPILPHLLQILEHLNLSRGGRKGKAARGGGKGPGRSQGGQRVSLRPLDLHCLLRLSGSHLREASLPGVLLEAALSALVEYVAIEAHSPALPELLLPTERQLQQLLRQLQQLPPQQRPAMWRDHCGQLRSVLAAVRQASGHVTSWRQQLRQLLPTQKQQQQQPPPPANRPLEQFCTEWRAKHSRLRQEAATMAQEGKVTMRDEAVPSSDSELDAEHDSDQLTTDREREESARCADARDVSEDEEEEEDDDDHDDDDDVCDVDDIPQEEQQITTEALLEGLEDEKDTVLSLDASDVMASKSADRTLAANTNSRKSGRKRKQPTPPSQQSVNKTKKKVSKRK